jgi:hypothetical protein
MSFTPRQNLSVILLISLVLSACGSTHQFVPNRPLPKGEWEFSAVVHYDLNRMSVANLIPEFNLYGGLGNDYDLGVGLQFPFFVTHVSAVRYFSAADDDRWAAYLHVNNLFGANLNPQIESGGIYFLNSPDLWESFSLGLGFGYRRYGGDYPSRFKLKRYLFGDSPRLIPTFKYVLSGKHLGFSYIHHFGMTKIALRASCPEAAPANDEPAVVIQRSSVKTILGPTKGSPLQPDSVQFILVTNDTVKVRRRPIPFSCVEVVVIPLPSSPWETWLANHGLSETVDVYRNGEWLYEASVDLARLRRDVDRNGSVIIVPYSVALGRKLNQVTTWKADHSLGIVYRDRIHK